MFERVIKTIILVAIYCGVWMILEKAMYGEVQSRAVDDIIMLLLIPVFFKAVSNP